MPAGRGRCAPMESVEVNTALLSAIVNSDALPSMPVVAFKVLELCRQEDVDVKDVADVIAKDPALTAKMLRLANSSMFGMSKTVASLDQAMMVLGLRTVKIMALGFSLVDTLKHDSATEFDYPGYWRRSLTTAVAARQLADIVGDIRRDEAFVAGLLCDIGMLAAERHPEKIYRPVISVHREMKGRIQDIETALLEITHAHISALMLANWSMPEMVCQAAQAHHGEGIDTLKGRSLILAKTLWAASEMAELFCGDIDAAGYGAVRDHIQSILGVAPKALDELMAQINQQVSEAAEMFSIELAEEISFDEIRRTAMMQMASLSLSAEQDRARAETKAREISALNETLRARAEFDKLTGIANRQTFDDHLAAAIDRAVGGAADLGLIMLDVDHFKKFNDTYGHLAGDEVLKTVGQCLRKISDETQFAARYGGEEFAVVVADIAARDLRALAEDIRKNIARLRVRHGGAELSVTASLGVAHVNFGEERIDSNELIRRADGCLYDAKREGRNRVEITF